MKKGAAQRKHNVSRLIGLGILLSGLLFLSSRALFFNGRGKVASAEKLFKDPISTLMPYRGSIYDQHLKELAVSAAAYSIYAHPLEIDDPAQTASILSQSLKIQKDSLLKMLTGDAAFVWITRRIKPAQAEMVNNLKLKGIYFVRENFRLYPQQNMAAQVIGFADAGGHGIDGMESAYDNLLCVSSAASSRKQHGLLRIMYSGKATDGEIPRANNLVLTLDSDIQAIAEKELRLLCAEGKIQSGLVVIMNAGTGAILALANFPGYNPNVFWEADLARRRNRSVADQFEMGNLIRLFQPLATAEKQMEMENVQGSPSPNQPEPQKTTVEGPVSLPSFYNLILRLGFGKKISKDVPGEVAGSIWPYSSYQNNPEALFRGEGISITPIQLITAFGAIINKGTTRSPYIVSRITDHMGKPVYEQRRTAGKQVCNPEIFEQVRALFTTNPKTGKPDNFISFSTCNALKPVAFCSTSNQALDKAPVLDYIRYSLGAAPVAKPEIAVLTVVQGVAGKDPLPDSDMYHRTKYVAYESLRLLRNSARTRAAANYREKEYCGDKNIQNMAKPPDDTGAEVQVMPDVRGKSMREALCSLQKYRVPVAVTGTGVAISQSPCPGTRLNKITRCAIEFKPL